jgi:dTMP kinase
VVTIRHHKGLLITFEKTAEGLGGTTQCHWLCENLLKAGIDTVLTRETGGTLLGQQLTKILKDPALDLSNATQLFLVQADRSQHYKEVLKPALKQGKVVVSDRYFDSTLVYQGSAQGWKTAFLLQLHHASTGMLIPDLTIVLDGKPHRELNTEDRWEGMGTSFHAKVKEGMLHFASKSDRYVIIDGNQDENVIAEQVLKLVKERFPKRFEVPTI